MYDPAVQRPDGRVPTAPALAPVAGAQRARTVLVAACVVAVLLGVLLGIWIGRASKSAEVAPVAAGSADVVAQLRVLSKPVEANVIMDGRFVGVTPVERIDLDPGKHSIVIDAFGYQPYAGTLEVEPATRGTFDVLLAPLGDKGATKGELVGTTRGGGKASSATIPPTALAPLSLSGTGTSREGAKPAGRPSRSTGSAPRYEPPRPDPPRYQPPRRDCSGERSQCRDGCNRADFSCRADCPGCVSCSSSVGWEECRRQCETCRRGCEQNIKFCESSCESRYSSCNSSQ